MSFLLTHVYHTTSIRGTHCRDREFNFKTGRSLNMQIFLLLSNNVAQWSVVRRTEAVIGVLAIFIFLVYVDLVSIWRRFFFGNRHQIDTKSVLWNNRKSKIDVKIDVKIGAKSAPNRRQIDEIRKSQTPYCISICQSILHFNFRIWLHTLYQKGTIVQNNLFLL